MSGNQHRGPDRRSARSGNSGHHRSGYSGAAAGKGGRGGSAAGPSSASAAHSGQPSFNNTQSFKKVGNVQGGAPPRPNQVNTISDAGAGFTPATPPKGAASLNGSQSPFQLSLHETPNALPTAVGEKQANVPAPRNSSHHASRGLPSQPPPKAPESSIPPSPSKGDQPRGALDLQFGSFNAGMMNGLQIPARTSSAPPNLDEQKRNQALLDASKAMGHGAVASGPKPQVPHPRKESSGPPSNASQVRPPTAAAALPPQQPKAPPVQGSAAPGPGPQLRAPNVMAMAGMPLQVPFPHQHQHQHQQTPLQFGGHGPQGVGVGVGVVPSSLQMTMNLPVGTAPPQVPQSMYVPGIHAHAHAHAHAHGLQQQALLHQNPAMAFGPPTGHQMGQPQLHQMGPHSQQYPQPQQQSPAKFATSARKAPTIKITHPDTHEEVKLENVAAAPRSHSQPIQQSMPPHMGYYQLHHGPFNPSPMYFPGAANINMPLTSTQMPTASQPPRYPYQMSQPQPAQGMGITFMNPPSVINQPPSGKPHCHGDAEPVPPPTTARPTVTIAPPVKVEAPKQPKPSDKPAHASQNLKQSDVNSAAGSTAQLLPENKVLPQVSATPTVQSRPDSAGAEMKKKDTLKRTDSVKEHQKKSYNKDEKKELEQPQLEEKTALAKGDVANIKPTVLLKSESTVSTLEPEETQTENKGDLSEVRSVATNPDISDAKQSQLETDKVQRDEKIVKVGPKEEDKLSGESNELKEKSVGESTANVEEVDKLVEDVPKLTEDNTEEKYVRPASSTSTVSTDTESLSSGSFSHANGIAATSEVVSPSGVVADKALKRESKVNETTARSGSREKTVTELVPKKSASKKKLRKEVLSKADAAGSSELYSAYKGPEEKAEVIPPVVPNNCKADEESKKEVIASEEEEEEEEEEEASGKGELDDWEDVADSSTPKLAQLDEKGPEVDVGGKKKYSRDFLLTFWQQCTSLPIGLQVEHGTEGLFGGGGFGGRSFDQPYPSPGRGQRGDRQRGGGVSGPPEEDRWIKSPGPFSPARDMRGEMGQFNNGPPNLANLRPGQGANYGVLKYPRGILSQPGPPGQGQGQGQGVSLHRSGSDVDRWHHVSAGMQRGLMPSPIASPHHVMHKADRKYEVGQISDHEQAKQRQLKAILNKLTPQNFEKLFEQVKEVNIDNPTTLAGVISQIFDKALMEPTFCEMYATFCSHLSQALPDFNEDNEKITFKRLLLNKCQEEFERGEREEAEAEKTEEDGEVKQTKEEREEKRVKARRRMLGNIRLIGELYKKKMLTERIMHECIKKLLGQSPSPDEEDIEALCKLMSTIGEMIDHPKAKEHMDAYFDIMSGLATNQKYSSRVRFMLKDAIDLRKNKWQQRRKVEGPKKIEEVHRDAAQERQAQASRLARGGPVMSNNPSMRRGGPLVSQQPGIRGMAPLQSQSQSSSRGAYSTQDVRFEDRFHLDNTRNTNPSLPLPQRANRDTESLTLGPQGGLGRGMSMRDRFQMPTNDHPYASRGPEDRTTASTTTWNHRALDRNFSAGSSRPLPPVPNQPLASSPGSTTHVALPDHLIKEKSVSAIREFYSAKDEKEVAMCIEELNSPGSYHLIISTWVSDSFERKEMERDLLYKLLVNLCKPNAGLFSQDQLHQGLESVLSTLEDAVNDAPKAPEFLGKLFGKFITENVMSLKEIGRLVSEGGEEPGMLVDAGIGGDVIGCTLQYIKDEKGDTFLNEVRAGSNLRLENFKSQSAARSKKLDPFL